MRFDGTHDYLRRFVPAASSPMGRGDLMRENTWLFLSSANLTEYAFTINMELGLLVTGGQLPGHVEEQFDRLIGMGMLERV